MQPSNYSELWDEICFMLHDSINLNIDEKFYEQKVLMAIEKLGWSLFKKEIQLQPKIQIGSNNWIKPDIVIYGQNNKALAVIEVKRPAEDIDKDTTIAQLKSYMRQMKADFGLIIGNQIQVYYEGNLNTHHEPISILKVSFEKKQEYGEKFVELFSKINFLSEQYISHVKDAINKFEKDKNVEILKRKLVSKSTLEEIYEFIKRKFSEFGEEAINKALDQLTIEVKNKKITIENPTKPFKQKPPSLVNIEPISNEKIYTYSVHNAEARMIALQEGGFIVLMGSTTVIKEQSSMAPNARKRKKELVESGQLVLNDEHNLYEFTTDVFCKSASLASGIVSGTSTDGPKVFGLLK